MLRWLFDRKVPLNAPAAVRKREASRRRPPAGLSTKLAGQEDKWNAIADAVGFVVAVYNSGEETLVDVLRVRGAYLNDRHTLVLEVTAPKTFTNPDLGGRLEWENRFELPIEDLRHYELLHAEFWRDGAEAYRNAVERGLKSAKDL
jgi:hypothetical protein